MKVMLLSDIHIGNYKTYNPTPDFRLNQFLKLKDFIVETCKLKNVYEIWIAGDLLQTAQSTPQVMSVVKTFLKGISERANVRIVLGNHDVVVRSDKTEISDYNNYTLVSLLDSMKNVYIYNDEVVHIGYKLVYFHSWVPTNEFEHKDADYLVCHGDIDKTLSPFSSSFINAEGYDRVFCGHIHIFKEIGNVISLGTPIMHSFSDSADVGLTIYDTDTDTYERVSTQGMFLEFKYAENEDKAIELSEDLNDKDVVIRVKPEKVESIDISSISIDPKNALKEFSKDLSEDSLTVLNNVISDSNEYETSVPDLRVKLKTLKAKNFLSIRNIEFNFEQYKGLVTIKGNVGAGKSTLFNLIEFMFFGKLYNYTKSDYTSVYNGKFEGELELEYKGVTYKIHRTLSSLEYTKNDKPQESNRKNDLQKILEDDLQFLRFFNLIYVKQSSTGIFSDMSDTNRVSFLSNLIGLDTIKVWTELLSSKIKELKNDVHDTDIKLTETETLKKSLELYNEQNSEHSKFIDTERIDGTIKSKKSVIEKIREDLDNKNTEINDYRIKLKDIDNLKENRNSVCVAINNEIQNIKERSKEIKELESKKIDLTPIEMPEFNEESPTLDTSDVDDKISDLNDGINDYTVKLKLCNEKLKSLTEHPDVCPTCGQSWHVEGLDEKINKLNSKISELNDKVNEIENNKSLLYKEKNEIKERYNERLNLYKENKNKFDIEMSKYREYTKKLYEQKDIEMKISSLRDSIIRTKSNIETLNNKVKCTIENGVAVVDNSIYDKDIDNINVLIETCNQIISDNKHKITLIEEEIDTLNKEFSDAKLNNIIYDKIQENIKSIKKYDKELKEIEETIKSKTDCIDELSKFNTKILSDKGLLVATLLQKVAEYLNTDKMLKVETVEELQNGSLKPTLNIKLFVKEYNKYVDYAMLSGGQRLLADLRFLKGITETLGSISVLFLDETFKFFSTETVFEGVEILKSTNVDKIFLILHGSDTESFSDKNINVVLTEEGSKYIV